MNNVIVIKLTDNWITNEQIKVGINQMLQKYGLEVEKNAITQVFAVNSIPFERRNEKDLIDFVKERIALDIGVQAMKDGLITQQARIKELEEELEIRNQKRASIFEISNAYERGRAEAIKEFAERLKADINKTWYYELENDTHNARALKRVDELVKEMGGNRCINFI